MPPEESPSNKKTVENRAHPRVETSNLISFLCLDAARNPVHQGMGKALDVSKSGLMLESTDPIETDYVSLLTTALDNRLIEIVGKVAYSEPSQTGCYKTGIKFVGNDQENIRFATSLIKNFHYRKKRAVDGPESPTVRGD